MTTPLRIFVQLAVRNLLEALIPRIETVAGHPLAVIVDLNPAIATRIAAGEAFDIALTNPSHTAALFSAGLADESSHRAFGRVPLAIGRKSGVDGPVATETDELVALLRGAASIAYTAEGTSGKTFLDALERLGLGDDVVRKCRGMGAGVPVATVAAGEVELAIAPLPVVLATKGVEPAAIFPDSAGAHIDISVFLGPDARDGAEKAVEFLTDREIDPELAAAGVMRFDLD